MENIRIKLVNAGDLLAPATSFSCLSDMLTLHKYELVKNSPGC